MFNKNHITWSRDINKTCYLDFILVISHPHLQFFQSGKICLMLFLVIADVLTSGSGFAAGSSELGGDRVVFGSLPAKFGNHKLKWLAIVSNNVTVTKKLLKKILVSPIWLPLFFFFSMYYHLALSLASKVFKLFCKATLSKYLQNFPHPKMSLTTANLR